jgi:hypothetical protein
VVSEARAALEEPHDVRGRVRLLDVLGVASAISGDSEGAVRAFQEELDTAAAAGLDAFLTNTHGNLAEALLLIGDEPAAAGQQAMALELGRALDQPTMVAFSMMVAARLVFARGEAWRAVVLQSAADRALREASLALYETDADTRDTLMAAAREVLGSDDFGRAVAEGRDLDRDAAADLAATVLAQVRQESIEQETMR